jgi:hypothetical protein
MLHALHMYALYRVQWHERITPLVLPKPYMGLAKHTQVPCPLPLSSRGPTRQVMYNKQGGMTSPALML